MTSPTEQRLGEVLRDLVAEPPFAPDTAAIARLARRSRRRMRLAQGGVVAIVGAVIAVGASGVATPTSAPRAAGAHTPPIAVNGSLVSMAADVATQAEPTVGDATLVQRAEPANPSYGGWDLYTDDGRYFYSLDKTGLPDAVKKNQDVGDGSFAREIAAALYAVHGDLPTARLRMAEAPDLPGKVVMPSPKSFDNFVWDFGMDALVAGSSNPRVRAGVLRLYATLPDVTVTHTTVGGQPALTLMAGAAELPPGYTETLDINADTGVPLTFVGTQSGSPAVNVTYTSTRVTVADV
ncbi:MAG TPA: hypothetical protein VHZ97_29495, partial [Pseudonocardiaceae bacterium]|nr:hypothetical protein [Pseudonocardiaceae bacterium]